LTMTATAMSITAAIAVAYVTTLIVFVVIDVVWLAGIAKSFYRAALGDLLAERVNFAAAVAFYLVFAAGLTVFVTLPALRDQYSFAQAFSYGALFGGSCYATYDLSNLATLRGWRLSFTLVDIAWGALLSGVSAVAAVGVIRFAGCH
jgi:uncharacterized membrane protein